MRGPGHGEGGKAPEDDTVVNAFVSEQSRSAMTAGKILLQWKTQGPTEPGRAEVDYKHQVGEIRKGLSEAILKEQVPPGYHDAIRQYFDDIGEGNAQPDKK